MSPSDTAQGYTQAKRVSRRLVVYRSGCSTLLKTIAGETHGLEVEEGSYINYQGESRSFQSSPSTQDV